MSDGLAAFLKARISEDEAVAREAAGLAEHWIAEEPAIGVVLVDGEPLIEGHITGLTAHIARHDPARAFREVAFKRAILGQYQTAAGWSSDNWPLPLRLLAAVWSDHPDYRPEWKP